MEQLFNETLEREGISILKNGISYTVFFRKNNTQGNDNYITMFSPLESNLLVGDTIIVKSSFFLIIQQLTTENIIYNKYVCVKCNQTVKYMLRHELDSSMADLITFNVVMDDSLSDKVVANTVNTLESTAEFKISLDNLTRRIGINERFYCGSFHAPWKITELNYLNNIVTVYCKRTTSGEDDDQINGIADRWTFEHKPDTYTVSFNPSSIEFNVDDIKTVVPTVFKNDIALEIAPEITWENSYSSIISIESNNIKGLSIGKAFANGYYRALENDIAVKTQLPVLVNAKPALPIISISPAYSNVTYYNLKQGQSITFTANATNITNPSWNITLNPNGNVSGTNYTSTINNVNGTIVLKNVKMSSYKMIYTISEITSGLVITYEIKLSALF